MMEKALIAIFVIMGEITAVLIVIDMAKILIKKCVKDAMREFMEEQLKEGGTNGNSTTDT